MHMSLVCMYVCLCAWCLRIVSGGEVTDGCKLPCRRWELSSDPLEEQQVVFPAEPSFQNPKEHPEYANFLGCLNSFINCDSMLNF